MLNPMVGPQLDTMNPRRPSTAVVLAVLPFENLSANDELAHFARGFAEDIITDLSRFKGLHIMSSYSTASISDFESERQFIRDNKVTYLVKGSFRHDAGYARITTQLIHAEDNRVLWAERYAEPLEEVFHIQCDIAQRIVSTLSRQIDFTILSAARRKPVTNLDAYDCWLRGMEQLRLGAREHDLQARELFNKALEIDPHFTRAYTGLSLSYFNEWSCQLWDKWDENETGAYVNAEKAAQRDETDYVAQMVLARTLLYRKQFDRAQQHIRNALVLNSNDADCLVQLSMSLAFLGEVEEAEELYRKAVRLNPGRTTWYNTYGVFVYFAKGEYRKGIDLAEQASFSSGWLDFPAYLAFCYTYDNQPEKAQFHWQNFLAVFEKKISGRPCDTSEIVDWLIKVNPFRDDTVIPRAVDCMQEMGILDQQRVPIAETQSPTRTAAAVFRKEGDVWMLHFEGKTVHLPALKGLNDIALLLSNASREIHCSELMDLPVTVATEEYALDGKAKREYRLQIRRLQEEIDEAEQMNDSERVASLRESLDQILDHLSTATDIYGRPRKLGSATEKTRSAVTWRIRNTIKKITQVHPTLGVHLTNSIKTGTYCCYSPEKTMQWTVGPDRVRPSN
ncbi:MAG TPA: CDC27 family protein [Cyclobacteriaceae bacterium]